MKKTSKKSQVIATIHHFSVNVDIDIDYVDGKILVSSKARDVIPFKPSQSRWFSYSVAEAAEKAAISFGRTIIRDTNSYIKKNRCPLCNYETRCFISHPKINSMSLKCVEFRVTVADSGDFAGFAVCSPYDEFSRKEGIRIAKERIVVARRVEQDGIPEKPYAIDMVKQYGNSIFSDVIAHLSKEQRI